MSKLYHSKLSDNEISELLWLVTQELVKYKHFMKFTPENLPSHNPTVIVYGQEWNVGRIFYESKMSWEDFREVFQQVLDQAFVASVA